MRAILPFKWKVKPYTEDIDLRYAPLFMIEDPGMPMIESIDGVLLGKLVNFTRINEVSKYDNNSNRGNFGDDKWDKHHMHHNSRK